MKKVYFISDLHLGAKYIENHREHESRVVRFLDSIASDASQLYMLGDILDYWYEYRTVVPRGHVRFFGALSRLADAGVKITWLTGNHDVWLFDYLRHEIGITVLKSKSEVEIMGHHFLISHGDDMGHQPPRYRFMRWCFYNRVCQWLYASIHPRWTHAIATGWSAENRTTRRKKQHTQRVQQSMKRSVDNLLAATIEHTTSHRHIEHYIYGHLHVAQHQVINDDGVTQTILGDWITQYTYAEWDGTTLLLKKWSAD